ncbi:hypothetical protein ACHAXA_002798 [Cyclostephanos tholiformis]|uniref:Uncharacterized protein n=1 Tax=Cyclostephanos tholiformis TaxID=382380 RepID=A0ABD3RQN6_9STRA
MRTAGSIQLLAAVLLAARATTMAFIDDAPRRQAAGLARYRTTDHARRFRLGEPRSFRDAIAVLSSQSTSEGQNFYNDFDDDDGRSRGAAASSSPLGDNYNDDDDADFLASLRRRRELLRNSSRELLGRWTSGSASSRVGFTVNESFYEGGGGTGGGMASFDWVRRVSIGSYPRVACGSASGGVFVADVESGKLLGSAPRAHWPSSSSSSSSSFSSSSDGSDDEDEDLLAKDEDLIRLLYGDYDGGGVLAVALTCGAGTDDLIASAGREGGIKLHRWIRRLQSSSRMTGEGIDELELLGSIRMGGDGNDDAVVTCLRFDSLGRRLYAGGGDGRLTILTFEKEDDIVGGMRKMQIPSWMSSSLYSRRSKKGKASPQSWSASPILSLDYSEALGMLATAHANGDVRVYSLDANDERFDDSVALPLLGVWNPFADTNDACHARSVAFVSCGGEREGDNDDGNDDYPSWSIVAGGGNGRLWMQEIHPSHYVHGTTTASQTSTAKKTKNPNDNENRQRMISTPSTTPQLFRENSMQQVKPSHRGPVLSMTSRPGGILISAGHDGMLRVSCLSKPVPRALYGLGGYKVWIGSICVDDEGKRLLSDGRDDVVVVHDFSKDDEG